MGKIRDIPADLIKEWAQKQTAASAKLEGIELPDDFVPSVQAQQFLNMRKAGGPTLQRPVLMANGEACMYVDD